MIDSFQGTVLLFAVEREAKAFLRLFPGSAALSRTRWLCKPSLLVEMLGVGKSAARAGVEAILAGGARPQKIIVAGFAGALRAGLPLAHVIVASEIVDEHGGRWEARWPEHCHAEDLNARRGRVLTCDQMIGEPVLKIGLGRKHDADCVEMESAAVAEVCQRHGIPFGCVRVVSDDVNKPLSKRLMGLVESGRVSIRQVLWEVLRSPKMGIELIRLAKHTRRAADGLARKLHEMLVSEH
jgi:adenosylhomocysteine nucleosidase